MVVVSVVVIGLHIFRHNDDEVSISARGDLITYTGLIVFSNSLINPLIYTIKIPEVKVRFMTLLCCLKPRSHNAPSHTEEIDLMEL